MSRASVRGTKVEAWEGDRDATRVHAAQLILSGYDKLCAIVRQVHHSRVLLDGVIEHTVAVVLRPPRQ